MIQFSVGANVVDFKIDPSISTDEFTDIGENMKDGDVIGLTYSVNIVPNDDFIKWCSDNNIGEYHIEWKEDDDFLNRKIILSFENDNDGLLFKMAFT